MNLLHHNIENNNRKKPNISYNIWYIFILCFFFGFTNLQSQSLVTGIYFVDNDVAINECENVVSLINKSKKYCLLNNPIIKKEEFRAVGKVREAIGEQKYTLNIKLSDDGLHSIKTITTHFRGKKLALVIAGNIVSIIKLDRKRIFNTNILQLWMPKEEHDFLVLKKIREDLVLEITSR